MVATRSVDLVSDISAIPPPVSEFTSRPMNENVARILAVVQQIPYGQIATYGGIARLAGLPRNARQVGKVLGSLPPRSEVPWHRVVNSQGKISQRGEDAACTEIQRELLEDEGVTVSSTGRIDLDEFLWDGT